MKSDELKQLEAAWAFREKIKAFEGTEALRVFHGTAEGKSKLHEISIDRFGEHYWITLWGECPVLDTVSQFLQSKGAKSAVHLLRPVSGVPADPETLFGTPPAEKFAVNEGKSRFLIQLIDVKHPGLFLDHLPLRNWLTENSKGLTVLNTFAYTGSLSVAAGIGGAKHVTTLDLSKPTTEWAKENWKLNKLAEKSGDFIFGDYFEWLPRFAKNGRKFDCVIIDPPSFSRGKKGNFSTAKDLERLHAAAFDVLETGGTLVTSINSANVSKKKYFFDIHTASKLKSRRVEIIREIELPQTFPTRPASGDDQYLKGWILKCL
jgi:23S rRNA (cytosine1962-C5)-methyltransferase